DVRQIEPRRDDADDALPVDRAAAEDPTWRVGKDLQAVDHPGRLGAEDAILAAVDGEAAQVEASPAQELDGRFRPRSAVEIGGEIRVALDDLSASRHRRLRVRRVDACDHEGE